MADEYIDCLECIEYGDFFLNEIEKLSGASKLVGGILMSLGRKDELRLFFEDLQVNESRSPKTAEETARSSGSTSRQSPARSTSRAPRTCPRRSR